MKALDDEFYKDFVRISVPKIHSNNYKEAKQIFLKGFLEDPAFSYDRLLQSFDVYDIQSKIDCLRQKIGRTAEVPSEVKEIYIAKLKEVQLMFDILILLNEKIVNAKNAQDEIQIKIEKLYGKPDINVFNHLLNRLRDDYYQLEFPVIRSKHYSRLEKIFATYRNTTITDMVPVRHQRESEGNILTNQSSVKKRVRFELDRLGLHEWEIEVSDKPQGGFTVLPRKRMVRIPKTAILKARQGERRLTELVLKSIFAHEVHTHAIRAKNGINSKLKLLGIGLANYLRGEEGVATYREQMVTGASDYAGQVPYLAIGLAYGLDRGGVKRNFLETFRLMHDYFFVFKKLSGINSRNKAFVVCNRIYRGATGDGSANIFTKDIVYREGNIRIHNLVNDNGDVVRSFDVGKYDPANRVHVQQLQSIGILRQ